MFDCKYQTSTIAYIIFILAYEFERLLNTDCSHGEESFEKLDNAKDKCKINDHCVGVFQKNCNVEENYYECLKNGTRSNNAQIEGCFYKKFSISK